MRYWLLKSEPTSYSIDDLKQDGQTAWTGVRNYQARNFMRDEMTAGDLALFYHSNAEPPGVAGIAKISAKAHPDETAFDPKDSHYDPKSTRDRPIWMAVDVAFVEKFARLVPLEELRREPRFKGMPLLKPGQRLSVQPVAADHFALIEKMGRRLKPRV